ncbi:hypothetical protein SAMD00019534_002690 [Acytostelium subglobosum LB1]|uniref:hypothetical protein n=1 Tax=Acytostelium subglobosum LB1 TaxID=1410327 RepID=UPI0006451B4A|nr:hypothetical protein SAMD00019534_002690 [Acytostelium subglobosum LB1]GAM17094.1 hypothetical protein SAMD00019534_002690 [Acytostelium subglobosum LB1]|eukprot:XP_012759156.1 hypothetical protein SAMD00019534_002690 [Acytostelium subglobosum LB1]
MLEILVQSLYEVGKSSEALKLVNKFYQGGLTFAPINILTLCIHLLVYMKSYHEAKGTVINCLNHRPIVTEPESQISTSFNVNHNITQEEYDQLAELLVFHILFRIEEIDEARAFLQCSNLPQWKREGFTKSLEEMVQIREQEINQAILKQKQLQQQQQQQQQQHNSPVDLVETNGNNKLTKPSPTGLDNKNISRYSIHALITYLKQFGYKKWLTALSKRLAVFMMRVKNWAKKAKTLDMHWLRKMAPVIIWCTVIYFGTRHLLRGTLSRGNRQDTANRQHHLPNTSHYHGASQPQPPQRMRQLGSSNRAMEYRANGVGGTHNGGNNNCGNSIMGSLRDLASNAFNYRYG